MYAGEQPARPASRARVNLSALRRSRRMVPAVGAFLLVANMPESLNPNRRTHKGQSGPELAPPCVPGLELARHIEGAIRRGRPGCWIGPVPGTRLPLGVPKAREIRFWKRGDGGELFVPVKPLEAVLRPRLGLALAAESSYGYGQLTATDRAEAKRLYAAALYDLLGLDYDAIANACDYRGDHREREARREIARARKLWHQLGGWPWFHYDAGEPPREEWRRRGGGPLLDAAFWTWATGWFHVPKVDGARPLAPRGALPLSSYVTKSRAA